jgi:hypothetical protein
VPREPGEPNSAGVRRVVEADFLGLHLVQQRLRLVREPAANALGHELLGGFRALRAPGGERDGPAAGEFLERGVETAEAGDLVDGVTQLLPGAGEARLNLREVLL